MTQDIKLVSYYIDKKGRLFEITKYEDGLIHVNLITQPHTQLIISPDDSQEIELEILEIP